MIDVRLDLPRLRWEVIAATVALHFAALLALLPVNFSWIAVGVAVFLHWLTIGLGISLGFHRLATHRSFKVPKGLEYFFILCGTLAGQGAVLGWIGYHRMTIYMQIALVIPMTQPKDFGGVISVG